MFLQLRQLGCHFLLDGLELFLLLGSEVNSLGEIQRREDVPLLPAGRQVGVLRVLDIFGVLVGRTLIALGVLVSGILVRAVLGVLVSACQEEHVIGPVARRGPDL